MSCVVFAKDVNRLVSFYQPLLNATVTESAKSHTVLVAEKAEVVIHAIPAAVAKSIVIGEPPKPRGETAIKPVFIVDSLQRVYAVCQENGGGMKPLDSVWDIRGYQVLDGWDPEGNVLQFKQRLGARLA